MRLIKFALYVPLALLSAYFRAYVLAQMYAWFVVPTFHTPPITPAAAYGIATLLHLATYVMPKNALSEEDKDGPFRSLFAGCVISLFALGLSWAVQRWWL